MARENRATRSNAQPLTRLAASVLLLLPLSATAAGAATITCSVLGECESGGTYEAGELTSYVWNFFDDANIWRYSMAISGTAAQDSTFTLFVSDDHVPTVFEGENDLYALPSGVQCIPLFNEFTCVIFDVSSSDEVVWSAGSYDVEMRWIAPEGETDMRPPDDGRNGIYRAESGEISFNDPLEFLFYLQFVDDQPDDPALGGRGDTFSSFLAGRDTNPVPEPASIVLLGSGLAAALYARRRRR